ncbi:MarR family winged helix-turn-helix transcriptional regulator [Chelatococcus reniformis]|uniref:Transcriptional regulator n=1 Tax=Chelatococcus reniformis TaxID=1494448 RepID=A0A916XLD4_9HYPH|nr:MarR family winged helix-turn-helix transcriptional regulator [Chelatococcus reniformis]GGC83919.1 transcriptional regulator [Chelatococcus reniformis]
MNTTPPETAAEPARPANNATIAHLGRVCACLHTRMTARALTRVYDELLRPSGLKVTQLSLLAAIEQGICGSISTLADRLAFERTTLTRNLQLLREAGLIVPREGTGRAVAYELSPEGRAALARALPLWKKAQDMIEASVGPQVWTETRDSLKALRKAARQVA